MEPEGAEVNFKHGLSELRKARGDGPIHRQWRMRVMASCGQSLVDPMVLRTWKAGNVTCPVCLEDMKAQRRLAKIRLAAIEVNRRAP